MLTKKLAIIVLVQPGSTTDDWAKWMKVVVPEDRTFRTKPELGWQMIQRVRLNQVLFEAVVMDDLYGRNNMLRQRLDQAGVEYYGNIPANTIVYLDKPKVTYPKTKRGKRSKRSRIIAEHRYEAR